MKYYDSENSRLVFIAQGADAAFWDEHWQKIDFKEIYPVALPVHHWLYKITRKFLPKGAVVLEGGAGLGQNSWILQLAGYRVVALDFAFQTLRSVSRNRPGLNLLNGNVFQLSLRGESLDGYWSLGVIEHFYEGFDGIVVEAKRALRGGGYLFVTFPCMNMLRRVKARFGMYEKWKPNDLSEEQFYQFALDRKKTIGLIESYGFDAIYSTSLDGVKGAKGDVKFLWRALDYLYQHDHVVASLVRSFLEVLLAPICGHMALVVFKRK